MAVQLTDTSGGIVSYQESVKDLTLNGQVRYQSALVSKGTWLMYKKKEYNDSLPGAGSGDVMIIKPRKDEHIISNHDGSMYLISDDTDGLVLFKHIYYGGVDPEPHVSNVVWCGVALRRYNAVLMALIHIFNMSKIVSVLLLNQKFKTFSRFVGVHKGSLQ